MTYVAQGAFAPDSRPLSKLDAALASFEVDRPTLIIDAERVADQYHALKRGLGFAHIHYAVKANPTREVIERLVAEGSHFDAASRGSSGDLGNRAANEISRTGFTIQAGAFSTRNSAVAHAETVSTAARSRGMPSASVIKSMRDGKVRWLVQIGNYPDRAVAQSNLNRLGGGLGKPYVTAISATN